MKFSYDPIPHDEARRLIEDKPLVTRAVFDGMHPELKQRAFTITGVEDFDIQQGVLDQIAKVPAGADWSQVKKEIARQISPWFDEKEALRRAELLLSWHARSAYSACHDRIIQAQADIFTHCQYLTNHGPNVRPTHAALDKIILPTGHKFWLSHTGPWEFNCHCTKVPMMAEEADEESQRDSGRAPEDRRVLNGAALTHLENGRINRGPSMDLALGKSLQNVGDFTLPYEEIATRWEAKTRAAFEDWAAGIPLENGSLLEHLSGAVTHRRPRAAAVPRPASFTEALAQSGLTAKAAWTRAELANLRATLREKNPAAAADLIAGITGARQTGVLTEKEILRTVQDLLDITPPKLAATLPPVQITFTDFLIDDFGKKIPGVAGDHRTASATASPRIRISMEALKGLKGESRRREMRRILSHELMHWLHRDATHPKAVAYRAKIRAHYAARTAGDIEIPDGEGGFYRPDHFWDLYAGREYKNEKGRPAGLEIPPRYFELWETPDSAIKYAHADDPDSAAFRETFALVHSIFDSIP